ARAELLHGLGAMGDSYTDEYQFYSYGGTGARNWVEILAQARGLNFGAFSTTSRGEPRNQGSESNWPRAGATAGSLSTGGQHTGLGAQVADGEVTLAWLSIGLNDFRNVLRAPDPAAALAMVVPNALVGFSTALDAVYRADPDVRIVVATVV